jgi:excisionase family DNA binding protein
MLRLHRGGRDGAKLLTVAEVADRLDVSAATVYKLCERGELAHARILHVIHIDAADVSAPVRLGQHAARCWGIANDENDVPRSGIRAGL